MNSKKIIFLLLVVLFQFQSRAQVDKDQLGAWYMYFWTASIKNSQWGFQGDVQYRNWNILGDLEQLLLRGGFTYQPKDTPVKFTLGYANITTGAFGESTATTGESRIYQEALLSQKIAARFLLTHRFRFEQRFVEDQDTRTRYRYNLFLNIPLNKTSLEQGAIYLALYNELFVNGQKDIGDGRTVELFDRNRFYTAFGYSISNKLRTQLGIMRQTTNANSKNQLQISIHHSI